MKYCVIGRSGFIGGALAKRLKDVSSTPTKDTEIIFDFGSPVHPPFELNPTYYMQTILPRFLYFLSLGKYYIWPSSALVYEESNLGFSHFKKALEEIASIYPNNLGLRIFPVYGKGEERTFIYQACKAMKKGKSPKIYGNGLQTRNFVYIDDLVDEILNLAENKTTGIIDIGGDMEFSFNQIVRMINRILKTNIKPEYIKAPANYSLESPICHMPLLKYISLYEGLTKILE